MSSAGEIRAWQEAIEGAIDRFGAAARACGGWKCLDRVMVVGETLSTQDVARAAGEQGAGVVVAALRQTGGRGRLGRSWADTAALGMAVSMAIDVRGKDVLAKPGVLALAAGLGALRGVQKLHCTPEALGMKWPNDVVERASGRKLSGVLIEQFGMLVVVGVGVNVLQRAEDFPPELGDLATSLTESDVAGAMQVGRVLKREAVAASVVEEVAGAMMRVCLDGGISLLEQEFASVDVLRGTKQALVCDGVHYRGKVLSIEPLKQITIATSQGTRVLPAANTMLERFQRPARQPRPR